MMLGTLSAVVVYYIHVHFNPNLLLLIISMHVHTVINCSHFGTTGKERKLRNGSTIMSPPHHTQCLSCIGLSPDILEITPEFDPHNAVTDKKAVYKERELFMCFVPSGTIATLKILVLNVTSENHDHMLILTVSTSDHGPGKLT